jgi:hypothetical protein
MNVKHLRSSAVLPSRPDPAAKLAKRIDKALEPKSPLGRLENLAKKIGRPTHPARKTP